MASNMTSTGAAIAMAALDGALFLGLGRGQNATRLQGEPTTGGYARQAVTVTATGRTAVNAAAATFTLSAALGPHTHWGLFTALTGGDCLWVGALAAPVELAIGTVTVQPGDIRVAIEEAA